MKDKAKANNMKVKLRKGYYNMAKVQEDGITYITDDIQEYPLYELEITKTYYDIGEKEAIASVVEDLKVTIKEFEQLIDKKKKDEIADKIKDKLEANDMKAAIRKGYSNKAKVQEDGITYIPDTKQEYPLYQLQITKAYYNMEKEAVIVSIIEELKTIITELEQLRDEKKKEEIER